MLSSKRSDNIWHHSYLVPCHDRIIPADIRRASRLAAYRRDQKIGTKRDSQTADTPLVLGRE
jgi:hypothetical protein